MIETISLEQAADAYARMMQGKARFRTGARYKKRRRFGWAECAMTKFPN